MIANLTIELTTLREQTEKIKVNDVVAFHTSQPYFDKCSVYYGDRFDDYLKQVVVVYPDLDLS